MMSLVDSGSIDKSLLDLLWIALDATSSDEVRKIERSIRLMAARNLAPCIRSQLLLVRQLTDGAVSASTAAAESESESVDRWTSRKSPQREELQADGGQLDIFAEEPGTDLKRKSVAAAERNGSLHLLSEQLYPIASSAAW
jgi:hypothetical protein